MSGTHRLKLRLPGGSEFEAEGSPEFISAERARFLANTVEGEQAAARPGARTPERPQDVPGEPHIAWEAITEQQGGKIQLRAKLKGSRSEKDACLVLLAASHKLLHDPKPTAAQLAKWLRSSGYPIGRMDRTLADAISEGEILSSGSRRARRYELTAHGRLKAYILANELTLMITGRG